ncbi:MAG: hypothetical protein ACYC7M_01360 [Bellilinea sp.]
MLDLNIYPYDPISGKDDPVIPGLFTGLPPRHAARGREDDRLVLYLTLGGTANLTAEVQREILEKLTTVFYNTRGTVTFALQAIVNQLNDRLLARNLRGGKETASVIGLFHALVLHGSTIYIAQSGPAHTFIIGQDGVQDYFDPESAGRGLGTSRTASVRFYRAGLNPGDRILFCAKPPAHLSVKNLTGSLTAGLELFIPWLLGRTADQPRFLLLQANRGKGLLNLIPLASLDQGLMDASGAVEISQPDQELSPPPDQPAAVYISGEKLTPEKEETSTLIGQSGERVAGLFAGFLAGRKKTESETESTELPPDESIQAKIDAQPEVVSPQDFSPETYTPSPPEKVEPWSPVKGEPDFSPRAGPEADRGSNERRARQRKQAEHKTRKALAVGLHGWRAFKTRAGAGLNKVLGRILPGQADHLPTVSATALIFIAVAVPLIVVAVATTVYIQNGRGEQHQAFIAQSKEAFAQGQAQTDAVLQRVNYEAALDWVEKAEGYGVDDESRALKDQISRAIDAMDGISRFELQHALPADFDRSVRVTQIWAAQTEDLYLLDGANGRVLRMVYTRPGYELDSQFSCGQGMIGSLIIGPLVDIILAPAGNNFGAVVLGVDAAGNLLYCSLDATKTMATTLPPPDAGWGNIQAIAYQNNVLSILDTNNNAVWRFEGFGLDFSNKPRLFFDNEVPNLAGAIDLAIYMDDLFVLNQDGHMLMCTYSYVETTPTRCTDPYPYRVSVSGQEPQALINMDAQFTQMQATQPPEPSLYFLDASGRSIQQFSMSLNFVRRLQPRTDGEDPLPDTAPSAFAVTNGRNLVVAYDNQVFVAPLPAP